MEIIIKTTVQSCCEVKELMHVKLLEECLAGIQHLVLPIITIVSNLLSTYYALTT